MSVQSSVRHFLGMALVGAGAFLATVPLTPSLAQGQQRIKTAQGVDYRIEAILDEGRETLVARARLHYTHNGFGTIDTLFFHQYLNAFRPNSDWARREMEFDETRFSDLGPDEHAFERLLSVSVEGQPPSPSATPAHQTPPCWRFPSPIPWSRANPSRWCWIGRLARPPCLDARAGGGRHYDFAQWYPRIATYDEQGWQVQPLMPQGEFYGEFATFDVTMDVASDQVMGSTGVPVEGDPGLGRGRGRGQLNSLPSGRVLRGGPRGIPRPLWGMSRIQVVRG